MRTRLALIALSISAAFGACSSPPRGTIHPGDSLPAGFARVLADYESAWSRKDSTALAALFADDGFVLPNGHEAVRGRSAIESHYRGQGGPLALHAIAWGSGDGVGYIIGGFASERGQPDVGKFTLTLQSDTSGRWWIVSDMDNGNRIGR